jgi:signal transduction histidine kinase
MGWSKQDAMSLSYKSVLKLLNQRNEELDAASDPIQQAINTNSEIRTSSLTLVTKNDKKIMLSLVVSPVGESGSGVITVFHDVTKEKAEEREKAEFISTASHEMRTPVASIEGYLGLALNPNTAQIDARARDFIMKAHGSAEHLGRLFQDLLDVAKSEDGRMSNNPSVINLVTFVRDIVLGLKDKAEAKELRITYKPMPEDSTERHIAPAYSVNLDKDHIREIVDNLIENAIKYTPKGEIVVDVTGDDDHVTVSVTDSGIGIPAEDIPHLFQKFYRVDNKDTREIGGTGLGLFLSRRLAEMMGGRIWVESKYGTGSTFFVQLPRISSQEATRLSEQQAQQAAMTQATQKTETPIAATPVAPVQSTPPAQPTPAAAPQTNDVPRGQALTPEQIAAYVQKQRALAAAQRATPSSPAPQSDVATRTTSLNVPVREKIQ